MAPSFYKHTHVQQLDSFTLASRFDGHVYKRARVALLDSSYDEITRPSFDPSADLKKTFPSTPVLVSPDLQTDGINRYSPEQ